MELYIKTPFVDNNKYLPHLIEHCVLHDDDDKQFLYLSDIYAETRTGYTTFEWTNIPIEKVWKYLKKPVTQETFDIQKNVIKNELKHVSWDQKLYPKILQKISGKNIETNSIIEIHLDDLLKYQTKYYQIENTILLDKDGEIVKDRWMGNSLQKIFLNIEKFQDPKYFVITSQWEKIWVLHTHTINPTNILVLDFFTTFLEDFAYLELSKKWKYYHSFLDFSFTDQQFILMIEEFDSSIFKHKKLKEFFSTFKDYYVDKVMSWAKRTFIPHLALLWNYLIEKKDHADLIASMDFQLIEDLLKKIGIDW